MSESIALMGPSPNALVRMLESGAGSFMEFKRALSGLTEEQARVVPEGSPHSIADVLAHMNYWQEWVLDTMHGESPPLPEHAEIGWPSVSPGGWSDLVGSFADGIEECKALASDKAALEKPFYWGKERMSVGFALMDMATHNGYHLGQIVLLRQIIGAWPPEGGAYTW